MTRYNYLLAAAQLAKNLAPESPDPDADDAAKDPTVVTNAHIDVRIVDDEQRMRHVLEHVECLQNSDSPSWRVMSVISLDRPRHRQLAAAETLQPRPAPSVPHGRVVQPPNRRPFPRLLPAQTRREPHPHQALLALARRLVDVLWALLRDDRRFTPAAPIAAATA